MRPPYRAAVTKPSLDTRVATLAARQHGVVSRSQLQQLGVTRGQLQGRIEAGRWVRATRDAFIVVGAPETWEQILLTQCFTWGHGVSVSHRAAASVWSLTGFSPGLVELTVPLDRRRRKTGGVVVHRNRLEPVDVTKFGAIPVTTPARTLIDLASIAPRDLVEEALDDALRRKLVTIPRLQRRLVAIAGKGGRTGVRTMRALISARVGITVPDTIFETRLLRLVRKAGLPLPVPQYEVRDPAGHLVARPDFAYPDACFAVEADSRTYHEIQRDWARDLARRNALMLIGWRVLHVTWDDLLHRPRRVASAITEALAATR